ncbi:FecR family protein [Leptospira sarikeiensis]|uniref:Iron dicitrate transport regulator FecR n=1 Tax=Leptospira sarikeiensis TaxID=2484943 RepID=A0A4R9K338_9LEPT|nr:FecR domain-containing protein [Leptospira sarikeiensis]TGL60459.1 iron dicitrate transport regulator FecR [Leptospira sarikeiensis]
MKKVSILFVLGFVCLQFSCGKKNVEEYKGIITFVVGTVVLERGPEKIKVSVSQEIQNGDVLVTEAGSTATIAFGENSSLLEIQSDSRFRFDNIKADKKFFQEKGRSWLLSNKLVKGEGISLGTPTSTAGVRGTKFYTNVIGDVTMICHCEGKVELENNADHSKSVNDSDYLSITKGTKTIYLTSKDLQKGNVPYSHDHSELSDSPLGKQNQMTAEQGDLLMKLVEKKFSGK